MAQWIEVTARNDDTKWMINLDRLKVVTRPSDDGGALLGWNEGELLIVKESYEDLKKAVYNMTVQQQVVYPPIKLK